MRYIIDSNFEFCPESCQLTTFGTENFTITLNAPASRYLELLLERRSDLVLQHDFYEYAWGDDAKSVSVNTLYQNIALLRKSLRSISKDYNTMVLTIPKQGFQFNNNFSVQQLLGVQEPIPSVNDDVEINSVSLQEMLNESPPPARWLAFKKKLKKPLIYSVIALGVMAFFSAFYFFQAKKERVSPLNNYTLYPDNSKCVIYANSNAHDIAKIINSIQSLGVDCKTHPYLYITTFKYSNRTSVVACPLPIESPKSPVCTTFNLIGMNIK